MLEVNAFGDLLFNVWFEGRETFAEEIGVIVGAWGREGVRA